MITVSELRLASFQDEPSAELATDKGGVLRIQRNHAKANESKYGHEIAVRGFKPLLPEGRWFEAKYTGYSTAVIFNAHKVLWEFKVVQFGEWFDQALFRAFRARRVIGRPGPHGKFELAAGGEMYETVARLLDFKQRSRIISLDALRPLLFQVKTRTVRTNYRQKPLLEHLQYSVIEDIQHAQ